MDTHHGRAGRGRHRRAGSGASLDPEVRAAVQDILHGTSVDSGTEWLQRQHCRMMRREAKQLARVRELESQLKRLGVDVGAPPDDADIRGEAGQDQQHDAEHQPPGAGQLPAHDD